MAALAEYKKRYSMANGWRPFIFPLELNIRSANTATTTKICDKNIHTIYIFVYWTASLIYSVAVGLKLGIA